jgi:hypothetical protein
MYLYRGPVHPAAIFKRIVWDAWGEVKMGVVLKKRIFTSKYDYKQAFFFEKQVKRRRNSAEDAQPPVERPFYAVECTGSHFLRSNPLVSIDLTI